jgi:2-polyprenyl-6-methoxyphenol hydroxylase-like FAD-dependent oxidoreductase
MHSRLAAHAMTPNLGQGVAMAIEDAHLLARIWSRNTLIRLEPRSSRDKLHERIFGAVV